MEDPNIPSNNSYEESVLSDDELDERKSFIKSVTISDGNITRRKRNVGVRRTVFILWFVNVINYMDRGLVTGVLENIQDDFKIDYQLDVLQAAPVITCTIFVWLFGYLGDRFNRKEVMFVGLFIWFITIFLGLFKQEYGWFLAFRFLVGIGEASYSAIAPTIISDLDIKDTTRSIVFLLYYSAIPLGGGLGYIFGSRMAGLTYSFKWPMLAPPLLGPFVLPTIDSLPDPVRRGKDNSHHKPTTCITDIWELIKNKNFVLSTASVTCVTICTIAVAWWSPMLVHQRMQGLRESEKITLKRVEYEFAIIAIAAGVLGVPVGLLLAGILRSMFRHKSPMQFAIMFHAISPIAVAIYLIMHLTGYVDNIYYFIFIGFCQVLISTNYSIVADMNQYNVRRTLRSTAEALRILISNVLGGAWILLLLKELSEAQNPEVTPLNSEVDPLDFFKVFDDPTPPPVNRFLACQNSLFIPIAMCSVLTLPPQLMALCFTWNQRQT